MSVLNTNQALKLTLKLSFVCVFSIIIPFVYTGS